MAKSPAAKTVVALIQGPSTSDANGDVPSYLKGYKGPRTNSNTDSTDVILPRLKLLQAISPEVTAFESAKAGVFWHSILNQAVGGSFRFIPVMIRKSHVLFAPRGDSRTVLARAPDAIHWEPPDTSFEVKIKGCPKPVTWTTKKTVAESRLGEFGSSNPSDPQSPPASSLVYEVLAWLPDHEELSPAVIALARSGIKRGRQLISNIELRATRVPQAAQMYRATITEEKGAEGPYLSWSFLSDGVATEPEFNAVVALAERFKATNFKVGDEDLNEEAAPDISGDGGSSKEY